MGIFSNQELLKKSEIIMYKLNKINEYVWNSKILQKEEVMFNETNGTSVEDEAEKLLNNIVIST